MKKSSTTLEKILILQFCSNLFLFTVASPLSPYANESHQYPAYRKPCDNLHVILLREALESIPEGASILTQDNIFPHVSSQENSYVVPLPVTGKNIKWNQSVETILKGRPDYILIDTSTDSHDISDSLLNKIDRYNYELVKSIDNIYLYKFNKIDNKTNEYFTTKDSSINKGMNS